MSVGWEELRPPPGNLTRALLPPSSHPKSSARCRARGPCDANCTLTDHTEPTVCFQKTEGAIESTILVNEMMGSELHLHVTTNGEDKIILRLPTIDLTDAQRASLVSGQKLYFTFASKVVHMFDPQTEESLLF